MSANDTTAMTLPCQLIWTIEKLRSFQSRGLPKSAHCILAVLLVLGASARASDLSVPGTITSLYADGISRPAQIAISDDGSLFVGNGLSNPVQIGRVGPGGFEIQRYGSAIVDPDSVVVDVAGAITAPGAILVGGEPSSAGGIVWTYKPDGTALALIGPSTTVGNPNSFRIDSRGRLLFVNGTAKTVVAVTRGFAGALEATVLIPANIASNPHEIDIDTVSDEIVLVHGSGSRITRFSLDGEVRSSFNVDLQEKAIAVGKGEFWGNKVYAIDKAGNLVALASDGTPTVVGIGFDGIVFMTFSSTGVLYLSDLEGNRIFSIDPTLRASVRVSRVVVRFNSVVGRKYKVLYQSDVVSPAAGWTELTQVDGDGSIKSVEDSVGDGEHRFYRVVQVPQR